MLVVVEHFVAELRYFVVELELDQQQLVVEHLHFCYYYYL